jgi:hypothetical protein
MDVTKPYKFIGFRDIHGPKPYKSIGFRWAFSTGKVLTSASPVLELRPPHDRAGAGPKPFMFAAKTASWSPPQSPPRVGGWRPGRKSSGSTLEQP